MAGALAEEGKSLEEVTTVAKEIAQAIGELSMVDYFTRGYLQRSDVVTKL